MANPLKSSFAITLLMSFLLGVALPLGADALAKPDDVIAKVGDQTITFSQIDIMINSSDIVGMPIPSPGTRARNETRLLMLDKVISANLLYLDALKKGIQNDPVYRRDVDNFSRIMLGSMYRQNLNKDITVTDEEVRNYFKNNIAKGTPFTADVHEAIKARLREEKYNARQADARKHLRKGVQGAVLGNGFDGHATCFICSGYEKAFLIDFNYRRQDRRHQNGRREALRIRKRMARSSSAS